MRGPSLPVGKLAKMSAMTSIALLVAASWITLASPAVASAYVDPTGGGFLLQVVLGGITGAFLIARVALKQVLTRLETFVHRRRRDPGSVDRGSRQA